MSRDASPPVPPGLTAHGSAELRLLYELGCAFAARIDLDELSALVVQKCRQVLNAEGAAILLLDPERNELYFPYVADVDRAAAARLAVLRFPADRGIAGAVLQSGQPVRVDDVTTDRRFYSGVDRHTGVTTRAIICAPLRTRQGIIGVVQVLNPRVGGQFTDDDLAFLDALAGSVAVAIENARMYAQLKRQFLALQQATREHEQLLAIRRELEIARNIQESILPRGFPAFPGRTDFDLYAAMIPAREVGGDFYDFFLLNDGRLGVVVGDVSGKGVPAALFMAVSRTLLKSVALAGAAPGDCLRRANALLCLENSAEMFVTVFYGILNAQTGAFEYSNGGHNAPYLLLREGHVCALERTGGMVLGALEDVVYRANSLTLRPGDGLFLFSDGVTEAMDASGDLFSERRLETVLRQVAQQPPREIVTRVVDAVEHHSGGSPQADDITGLALRYHG